MDYEVTVKFLVTVSSFRPLYRKLSSIIVKYGYLTIIDKINIVIYL